MGLAHSPSIISDGLVFYLDAANRRSYAGSGVTWIDIVGSGNTCTLYNGPALVGIGGTYAFSFDGTKNVVSTQSTGFMRVSVVGLKRYCIYKCSIYIYIYIYI